MILFTDFAAAILTGAAGLFAIVALLSTAILIFSTGRAKEVLPPRTIGCADLDSSGEQQMADQLRCIDDAVARAVRKLNIESLSTCHRAQTSHDG